MLQLMLFFFLFFFFTGARSVFPDLTSEGHRDRFGGWVGGVAWGPAGASR